MLGGHSGHDKTLSHSHVMLAFIHKAAPNGGGRSCTAPGRSFAVQFCHGINLQILRKRGGEPTVRKDPPDTLKAVFSAAGWSLQYGRMRDRLPDRRAPQRPTGPMMDENKEREGAVIGGKTMVAPSLLVAVIFIPSKAI